MIQSLLWPQASAKKCIWVFITIYRRQNIQFEKERFLEAKNAFDIFLETSLNKKFVAEKRLPNFGVSRHKANRL